MIKLPDNAVIDPDFKRTLVSLQNQRIDATRKSRDVMTKALREALKGVDQLEIKEAEINALIYATTACYNVAFSCKQSSDNAGAEAALACAKEIKKLIPKARQP